MKHKQSKKLAFAAIAGAAALAAQTVSAQDVTIGGTSVGLLGDVVVEGDTLINGTLTVQPDMTTVVSPPVVTPGTGIPTDIGDIISGDGGDVKLTQTVLDTTTAAQTTANGGGFRLSVRRRVTSSRLPVWHMFRKC